MTPWLEERFKAADDAAWEYLIARRMRNQNYNYVTLHEQTCLAMLGEACAAFTREAVSSRIGTAA